MKLDKLILMVLGVLFAYAASGNKKSIHDVRGSKRDGPRYQPDWLAYSERSLLTIEIEMGTI